MPKCPRKILLIGWDAADWNVARPLIEQGKMPALKRLMDEGVSGNLATIRPVLSPMLWTSIATGKRAWKHGIHGFSEPAPNGAGIRPITNLSRKSKAIWNIFNQQGWKSNVIGWWPSSPAEPINGVMVSNHFQQAVGNLDKDWPIRPGTVHPKELEEALKEMRIHPAELENEHILPFIPNAAQIDSSEDKRLASCAKIIAEISGVHSAATACMQLEPWDFMSVYYDGIDHFGHGFMKFHPPRRPWVDEAEFELYRDVIESSYRYHDMMLDTLLKIAGDDTTVMLISDHGFEPGNLRPRHLPNEPAGPAAEHSPFGIFCLRGPGIRQGETIHGASLLDITPTLLHLNDLPVGRDMDGKVLVNCFKETQQVDTIDSWETVEGADGRHPANTQLDVAEASESIKQLVDLGYIDEPNSDSTKAVDETVRELRYNLAQAYMDGGLYADAAVILKNLWDRWPDLSRFGSRLLDCHIAYKDPIRSRETLERLKVRKESAVQSALAELEPLQKKRQAQEAARNKAGKADKPEPLTRHEQQQIRKLSAQASTNPHALAFFEGSVCLLEGKAEEAIRILQQAESVQTANKPSLYCKLGEAYSTLRDWTNAEAAYVKVLNLSPNHPQSRIGLAEVHLQSGDYFRAAAEALAALKLFFENPTAQTLYGTALLQLSKPRLAEKALLTAIEQSPFYTRAHHQLSNLYTSGPLADASKAEQHRERIEQSKAENEKRRREPQFEANAALVEFPSIQEFRGRVKAGLAETVVIVSGLPRSGTSLMMQMLEAGGLELASDGLRQADESNPKGYYEDERAKTLGTKTDRSWLNHINGRAIKIVAPLVTSVPDSIAVKVIFMQRGSSETIGSQQAMLERNGKQGANSSAASLSQVYASYLSRFNQWVVKRSNTDVLPINHSDTLEHPGQVASRIAEFIGIDMDANAMASVVDPSLYRMKQPEIEISYSAHVSAI